MIIRILGEGQYDVADHALDRLNELDTVLEGAVEAGDEAAFADRAQPSCSTASARSGSPIPTDSLDESDLILPPSDATIDEVREMLNDDGLIPGLSRLSTRRLALGRRAKLDPWHVLGSSATPGSPSG